MYGLGRLAPLYSDIHYSFESFSSPASAASAHPVPTVLLTTRSVVLENRTAPPGRAPGQVKTAGAVVLRNSLAFIPGLFFILLSDPGWKPPR